MMAIFSIVAAVLFGVSLLAYITVAIYAILEIGKAYKDYDRSVNEYLHSLNEEELEDLFLELYRGK